MNSLILFLYPGGCIKFVQKKYVTGRRRVRPHKVYIFLIRATSGVDIAMSVCPFVCLSVRMNERISEMVRPRSTKFGVKTSYICT